MATGFDRRRFLCGGCAAVTLACRGAPGTALEGDTAVPPGGPTGDTGEAPAATDYPCDQEIEPGGAGWTALPLADYPDLAEVGGWYPVTIGGTEIVVAHVIEGCYAAILRACAHEGEPIDYVPERGQFVCPRHAAIYDWQGDKVAGPQPTGLPVYPVGREGDTVWVRV